jgi:hypothetical protein
VCIARWRAKLARTRDSYDLSRGSNFLVVIVKTVTIGVLLALTASVAIAQNNPVPAATGPTMASVGTDSVAVARKYTVWF